MGKRKGQGGGHVDQYGDYGQSQDRDEHYSSQFGTGGRGKGGGSAGGSGRPGGDLSFQRQVPKFLQKYSHLLGHKKQREDEPVVDNPYQDDEEQEDDDAIQQEAIHRALQDNPELAQQMGSKYADKVAAAVEKEKGNTAFAEKRYQDAINHFTKCIELDPRCEVYFSNRSAAHAALQQYEEALRDANSVLALKPGWVKGHARQAAALFGLKQYGAAKECYQQALRMEPDEQALQKGLEKSEALEMQAMREHKHVFKKAKLGSSLQQKGAAGGGGGRGAGRRSEQGKAEGSGGGSGKARADKGKAMLSFADDEDEQ